MRAIYSTRARRLTIINIKTRFRRPCLRVYRTRLDPNHVRSSITRSNGGRLSALVFSFLPAITRTIAQACDRDAAKRSAREGRAGTLVAAIIRGTSSGGSMRGGFTAARRWLLALVFNGPRKAPWLTLIVSFFERSSR